MQDRLDSHEARLNILEASWAERVKALGWWEDRLAAWEARVKTLERNNPLEARLRAVEALQAATEAMSQRQAGGRSAWTLSFAWLQFAFGWFGKLKDRMYVAIGNMRHAQHLPSNNCKPMSNQLRQEPVRHDLLDLESTAVLSPLQLNPDLEAEGTILLNELHQLPEACDDAVDQNVGAFLDSSIEDMFFVQEGLAGYSQSLVMTADAANNLKSSRAKTSLLHREACKRKLDTYIDLESGYEVFTAHHLQTRDCCGSGCRHCPWGHRNVPGRHRRQTHDNSVKEIKRESFGLAIEKPICKDHIPKSHLYTRKGDAGYTNLYNEKWILKSEAVYDAIGDIDELNSAVGLAHALLFSGTETLQQLEAIQAWLLDIGSALCTPRGDNFGGTSHAKKLQRTKGVTHADVTAVERFIDRADAQVSELRNFILPGGTPGSSALQVARTICRRAERRVWPLLLADHSEHVIGIFLNRLSDYLFVVARLEARIAGVGEKAYRIERKVDKWQRQVTNT